MGQKNKRPTWTKWLHVPRNTPLKDRKKEVANAYSLLTRNAQMTRTPHEVFIIVTTTPPRGVVQTRINLEDITAEELIERDT